MSVRTPIERIMLSLKAWRLAADRLQRRTREGRDWQTEAVLLRREVERLQAGMQRLRRALDNSAACSAHIATEANALAERNLQLARVLACNGEEEADNAE